MTEWREEKLENIFCIVKEVFKPSNEQQFKYIGLEHIEQGSLRLNGWGYSNSVQSNKYFFKKDDVLFGKLRPYFRKIIKAPFDGVCSTDIWVCRAKNNFDQNFLFYFLANQEFVDTANSTDEGTRMPRADWSFLKKTIWNIPPLPEQKAIAEVLSSLDDKIDLLTRQNKTLEDLAQAYFRKWFIEDASDEWEVGKLGDEFNITMGQSPKGETYNDLKIGLPFFQGKAEFGFRFPLEKQYCSEPIKIADKFDTLLSVRAPVGALNMALYKCCIGRGLAIPIHKKGYKHYTFYKMKSLQELFNTFDDDGTVFGSISREKFLSIDNVIPPEKLVCYFDNFAKYFDLKIYENTVQIRTLSKLRDTLLPKLISGEVRVNI